MKETERRKQPCAACGKPVGTATIVIPRDGWDEGPEVPLCATCGGTAKTCEEVWEMIRARRAAHLGES